MNGIAKASTALKGQNVILGARGLLNHLDILDVILYGCSRAKL